MTVSSSTNRVSYSGNGSLTAFAYTFKVFDEDDLTVILRASDGTETVQTITTHYTVSGVGNAGGGNVTFTTAPATGVTVVILREQPLTQGLDLVPNDPFPAQSLEESLDKLTFITQQHSEELGRTIKASKTNTISGADFTISASDRANKVFAFDSSGDLNITQELGIWRGNWATSTAYNERDIVRDSSDGSIYIVNSAHTSTGATPLDTNFNSAKYDVIFDVDDMVAGNVTASGNFTINGNVTLGSDENDDINVNGDIVGSLIPKSSGNYFLGNQYYRWAAAYANRVEAMDSAQTNVFEGPINAKKSVTVGTNNLDRLIVNAYVESDLSPSASGTYRLGGTHSWSEVKAGRITSDEIGNPVGHTTIDTGSAGRITLNAGTSGIRLDASNGLIELYEDGVKFGSLFNSGGNLRIDNGTNVAINFDGSDVILAADLDVTGATNFNDTTTSTSTTTGSVVIDGGVGIAENVYVGGILNVGSDATIAGNAAITGNATITGDLTVNGTTTTISTANTVVSDALMELGNGTTGTPANDAGIVIERGDSDNAFIGWDESTDKFTVGTGSFTGASTGNLTITTGTLVADIEGDVTGNVTGNLDGIVGGTTPAAGSFTTISASTSITGDLTGDLTGDVKATNGTVVLDNGTDGTDATITATLTGNVTGNLTGDLVGTTTDTKALAPDTDSSYDIGTSALRYRTAYVDKHYFTETVETTYSITPTTSQVVVDPANGNIQYVTLNSNSLSVSLVSWEAGQTVTLMIDDGANYSLNWPVMTWVNNNGSNPTLKTSGYTVVTIWRVGTLYYGAVVGAA